jgi:hypothetical protein
VLLSFCLENEYLERDPALVLRTPKKREALADVLDQRELGRLLRVMDREDVWKRRFRGRRERDKLMLAVFAFTGLRHNELLCGHFFRRFQRCGCFPTQTRADVPVIDELGEALAARGLATMLAPSPRALPVTIRSESPAFKP